MRSSNPVENSQSKYHVLMELGRGGAAVVHAAVARGPAGFRKLVVLKATRHELADASEAVENFLKEARLSARMNHPNVVQVYEVYEDGGLPVIVMEYLEGQTLATFMARYFNHAEYDVRVLLCILCDALEGLHHAHSLSDFAGHPLDIVHRDVTPQNVMVTYEGQVKLLDFGIAKLSDPAGDTRSGLIKGKLGYMPREQVDGSPLDRRTDLFAIGVMLWEVVARRRMWGAQTEATILKHILCDEIPRLREAVPGLDRELEVICERALAPTPSDRYDNAHEFCLALRGYLETHGGAVAHAAIGELVSVTCADLKYKTQTRLEQELVRFSQSQDQTWNDASSTLAARPASANPARTSGRWPRERADTATSTAYTGQTHALSLGPRGHGRYWLLACVLGVAAVVAFGPRAPWLTASSQVPVTAALGSAEQAVPHPTVHVTFGAQPERALVYLDGVALPTNPFSGSLPSDRAEHELRFEAPGFETSRHRVALDKDLELDVTLQAHVETTVEATAKPEGEARRSGPARAHPAPHRSRRAADGKGRTPAPQHSRPGTAESAGTAPNGASSDACDPPYQIDELGIKRYRRECL